MSHPITLRPARPGDADACAGICFEAFRGINARHGLPPDLPEPQVATGLMGMVLSLPHVYGVVAEQEGRVVGSNFLWTGGAVAGVGPITVDPSAQGGVGRRLMEAVLAEARDRRAASVRLVQAA